MPKEHAEGADEHGRTASKVSDIPPVGWKDILWRTYAEIVNCSEP